MARPAVSMDFAKVVVRREFFWTEIHLPIWTIFMIIARLFLTTNFVALSTRQSRLQLGTPWIMTYDMTLAVLTEVFVWAGLCLFFQRNLLPGIVIIYAFVLTVIHLVGMIGTAVQLFGPVMDECRRRVNRNHTNTIGLTYGALIWLNQSDTCQRGYVVFSFWVSGLILPIWMMFLARSVP